MNRLALMIDLDRCIGCKSCEAACKQEHGLGPHEYRNKVLWLESPGVAKVDLLTVTCQHCERPACLRACPVHPKAIVKDAVTGVVSVDEDRCTGCGECVNACPYGAMGFDPVDHHAVKCDLCADRRSRDEQPACASVCPGHAIHFGAREDLLAQAQSDQRALLDHDHFLMGPATVYLPADDAPRADQEPRIVALLADAKSRAPLSDVKLAAPYRIDRDDRRADRVVPGGCTICFNGCPVKYHLKDDRVVGITGNDDDPIFRGRICPKSQMLLQLYNNERRLTQPKKRVGGKLVPITWEKALDEIAARLETLRAEHGPETLAVFSGTRSGIVSNNYLRLFAQLWGTPNTASTEPLCSAAKNLAFSLVQGERSLPNSYTETDIGSAELFVYVGDNQAETRPVYFGMVNDWRKRTGARLIAVDPRMSATATKADEWLAIRSGTDLALGLAVVHHIFANDLHDAEFCERWMEGWERWRDHIFERGYSPAWAAPIIDIAVSDIERLAEAIARADGCMIYASRGINQHTNATQTNRVFMFVAAMTGNWSRPGGGYFNIATTHFIQADAPAERRAEPGRPAIARTPTAWVDAIAREDPYPVKAFIAANNPFSQWPSQSTLREAVHSLGLFVHLALFENETSQLADYVLPIATGIEKGGVTRAAEERRIVWNDRLIDPPGDAKSDGWFWIELGKRFGFNDVLLEEYADVAKFWDHIRSQRTPLGACTVERFRERDNRTIRIPYPTADAPEIETLFTEGASTGKRFPTTSGKLEFWTEEQECAFAELGLSALPVFYTEREQLVDLPYIEVDAASTLAPKLFSPAAAHARRARIVDRANDSHGARLRAQGFDTELVTGRPPAPHFHSWTHDFWQAQEMWPDLYAQMHPSKARELGVADGGTVRIETTHGAIEARAWIHEGIRPTTVYVPIGWDEHQPFNPWRPVNFLTDESQRDPLAEQTNLKTRLCKVTLADSRETTR